MKNPFPPLVWRLLFAAALIAVVLSNRAKACDCHPPLAYAAPLQAPEVDSWLFAPSRYTHDPESGVRVAQYEEKAPVEPLPDQRAITSGYARKRSVLRGPDGNISTYYQVQNYGNGRGGMDAEWERFHDAWRGSTIAGGQFGVFPGYGYGGGFGGFPGYGYPGDGYGPGFGNGFVPRRGFGQPGVPDPRLLDPDGADGFRDRRRRTPDRRFFGPNYDLPGEDDD